MTEAMKGSTMKRFSSYHQLVLILSIGTVFYHYVEHFRWLDALYFSVIALTTAGFGDITPTTDLGKAFTIAYMLIGFGVMLSFLSEFYTGRQEKRKYLSEKVKRQSNRSA